MIIMMIWEKFFEGQYLQVDVKFQLESSPLKQIEDNKYMFIHKSFQEYFAAMRIIEEIMTIENDNDNDNDF